MAMGISELGFSWVDEDEREGESNEVGVWAAVGSGRIRRC